MAPKRRERWYSVDGQRRIHESALQSNTGPRRLISLVVLLILVMLMIQQVSDSKKVAKVAGAVGLLPAQNPTQSENPTQNVDSTPSLDDSESKAKVQLELSQEIEALALVSPNPTIERNSQVLEQLMRNLPTDVKTNLVEQIFGIADQSRNPPGDSIPTPSIEAWLASLRGTLSRWIDLMDSESPEHASIMELQSELDAWTSRNSQTNYTELPAETQRSVRLALDRTLLADLSDNTPWKTTERLSLARLLIRATETAIPLRESINLEAIPSISIPQLVSQTDTLRGRCYRFQGTIGLIDQPSSIELANNRKLHYSVLWIKPDDLSGQPINVYVPEGVDADRELKVGDSIEIAGLIAKRRAYASKRGGEITPVLIATCMELTDEHNEPKQLATPLDPQRTARSLALAKQLSQSQNKRAWIPPIDRQAPLDLVQQALAKHVGKIQLSNKDAQQASSLANDPATLACIANLVKFENEIDTVVSGGNNTLLMAETGTTPDEVKYSPMLSVWQGYVTKIQSHPVDNQSLPGLDWPKVYSLNVTIEYPKTPRADSNTDTQPQAITVMAKEIPATWRTDQTIYQPVVIQGLGLMPLTDPNSKVPDLGHQKPYVVLASHVAWQYPNIRPQTTKVPDELSPKLSKAKMRLIQSGWDLSQADALEKIHGQSVGGKEARAFYTLLAASQLAASHDSQTTISGSPESDGLKVLEWIRRTEAMKQAKNDNGTLKSSVAERIEARVQVRRIQRVDVRNYQHQDWLGANHYYQLDGVADIGPSRIEVKYGKDFEAITYERDFPITLVSTQLPSWILSDPTTIGQAGELDQGTTDLDSSSSIAWSTKIRVDVSGYAYRIWRFRTPEVSAVTQDTGYQQAPMLVVDHWDLAKSIAVGGQSERKNTTSMGSILTTILGLAAIGWFAFRMTSGSKKSNARKGITKHRFK